MATHVDYHTELSRAPLEVGDVGYIPRISGNFVRILNVHLEPGVDGQPSRDDLPGFGPLPKRRISILRDKTTVFKSERVTVRNIEAGASGTPFLGRSVAFSASSERGAILTAPFAIQCHDAQHILNHRNYAKAHIETWHKFAVHKLGVDLALEDIILVTGVDRTTSWATAVFTNSHLDWEFDSACGAAPLEEHAGRAC
ncbi:unnamed protein product [Peniophora sp. CBMAI 1063]|nr:unnamed protein product [Peniophora sp. CBMAI 1063]